MLAEAYKQTQYQIAGHGPRNINILKEAFESLDGLLSADMYGSGALINNFEQKIATYLGKEAAVFFPSGTMAQQIALRIWCDKAKSKLVAYHPLSHLEIHEQHGLKELHGIEGLLLGEADRLFTLDDLKKIKHQLISSEVNSATKTLDEPHIGAVLFELPQREIGGQLPEYEELEVMTTYCRAKEVALHLDGARLFESLPYYQKEASEVAALFDSVYLSFYKGIGGIAGAILAGDEAFITEAKIWKRRHGGDLISLYPYIVTADYYFDQRQKKMTHYYESAKEVANLYKKIPDVKIIPENPVSNMFHVHWYDSKESIEAKLIQAYTQFGIGLTSYLREIKENHYTFEVSLGDQYDKISKALLEQVFTLLSTK